MDVNDPPGAIKEEVKCADLGHESIKVYRERESLPLIIKTCHFTSVFFVFFNGRTKTYWVI